MDLKTFEEVEQIKKLKAQYFRLMDRKQWEEWRELFTEDFTGLVHGPHPEMRYEGREDFVGRTSAALVNAVTVHHGHMPEIELTGPTSATGIWAMFDYVRLPELTLKGYGHYEEEYVKKDGRWRIRSIQLKRLHVDTSSEKTES